jgi:hypothetical protein
MSSRLCPQLSLPPYRYLPGKNLHPGEGHLPELGSQAYAYGIDLYHAGFFFEAHEAWEPLWLALPKGDLKWTFLLGLIQNTAAQLKMVTGQWGPARQLSQRALHYLELVRCHQGTYMGLDLTRLVTDMLVYYEPLWQSIRPTAPQVNMPALRLHVDLKKI